MNLTRFLQTRRAVQVILCLLVPCLLPQAASALPWDYPADAFDAAEEFYAPAVLPPAREPQTPPEVLRAAILEAVIQVEEEARLEAEAEERLTAEAERAREDLEQQAAREMEAARLERGQARARAVNAAVQAAVLPPVGVIPPKKDWPLPGPAEDPAWNIPEIARLYAGGYAEAEARSLYPRLLGAAVHGNPRAMTLLSAAHERWGDMDASFAALYPPLRESGYWRNWASRLAGPGWVEMRLAELSPEREERLSHYLAAAEYMNAEALYRLALEEERPELLVEAALAGHALACSTVARNLLAGAGDFPVSPGQASFYLWRGALAGDADCLLACSELFFQGRHGFPLDKRRAYLFALLAAETNRSDGAAAMLSVLDADMGLSQDDVWRIRQELEIFRAAPAEELQSRQGAALASRAAALRELESELYAVRVALGAYGAEEQPGSDEIFERQGRQPDKRRLFAIGLAWMALLLGGYAALRLRLYDGILRFMSAGEVRI